MKSLTVDNWEEYVLNNTKQDVLVYFYSIGCYECTNLKPMYYHLAKRFEANPNILFARINIGDNDVDNVSIKQVPEFKLFKSNNKDPINFIYTKVQSTFI